MERQQLINFQKAAQYNNMSRAAKELYISQPAISKSIAEMENELGVQLFDRRGKRIRLNETGRKVLVYVDQILAAYNQIFQLALQSQTEITINILAKAADQLVPEIVFRVHEKYPNMRLQVSHYRSPQVVPDIVITSSLEQYNGNDGMTVLKENFVLVVPADHELAKKKCIEFSQLDGLPMVMLAEGVPLREIILHWMKEAGIRMNISYECDTCVMMRELINTGKVIGLVPTKTWSFPFNRAIRVIPIKDQNEYRYVNIICDPQGNAEVVNVVYEFIADYFKSFSLNE